MDQAIGFTVVEMRTPYITQWYYYTRRNYLALQSIPGIVHQVTHLPVIKENSPSRFLLSKTTIGTSKPCIDNSSSLRTVVFDSSCKSMEGTYYFWFSANFWERKEKCLLGSFCELFIGIK